jgi:hypothetical protein
VVIAESAYCKQESTDKTSEGSMNHRNRLPGEISLSGNGTPGLETSGKGKVYQVPKTR